jgi:integrase
MKLAENLSIILYPEMKEMTSEGKAPVYVRITITGFPRKEFSTGIKVDPNIYNKKTWQIDGAGQESLTINSQLLQTRLNLQTQYLLLTTQYEYVTPDLLKQAYKGELNKPKEHQPERPKEKSICQVFNFKYSKFAKQVKKGLRSDGTRKKWKTTKKKLREFLKHQFGQWDIPLSFFKYQHAEDFFNFLTLEGDLCENTARKYVKNVKNLLQIADNREWLAKNRWKSYQIGYDQPDRDFLEMPEIITLFKHKFIGRLDYVRDIALFACFTGYAFGELKQFTKQDIFIGIDGKRWIKIDRKKTGKPVAMPLLPIPAAIVDKYANDPYCVKHGKLLPLRSLTHYNGYLKEIGDICGSRFELSSHKFRHTFATTVCLDNDVPLETVSRLLGHTNVRTTEIYAKITRNKISSNMTALQKKLFQFDGKRVREINTAA